MNRGLLVGVWLAVGLLAACLAAIVTFGALLFTEVRYDGMTSFATYEPAREQIVEKRIEAELGNDGAWRPWARGLVQQQDSGPLVVVGLDGEPPETLVLARALLTVRYFGDPYSVSVSLDCWDAVRVGDHWPSEHEVCR